MVGRWTGPVGALQEGAFVPDSSGATRYVASKGMRSLATYLAGRASRALQEGRGNGGRATSLNGEAALRCSRPDALLGWAVHRSRPAAAAVCTWRPVATPGCSPPASRCAGLVEVRRPQWVSDVRYTQEGVEGWRLEGRGRDQVCGRQGWLPGTGPKGTLPTEAPPCLRHSAGIAGARQGGAGTWEARGLAGEAWRLAALQPG